jgi:TonB family protein
MRTLLRLLFVVLLAAPIVHTSAQDQNKALRICYSPSEIPTEPCGTAPMALNPVYRNRAEEALGSTMDGDIELLLTVSESGIPQDIRLMKSLGNGMDEIAIAALKQIRFQPGMYQHHAVAVEGKISLHVSCSAYQAHQVARPTDYRVADDLKASIHKSALSDCGKDAKMHEKKACAPVLINWVLPWVAKDSEEAKTKGTVGLFVGIQENGTVDQVQVFTSTEKDLNNRAIAVVQQWRFVPALYKGRPIRAEATFELQYWSCIPEMFWTPLI